MLKKTALSCAASAFTAVPGRDCHQQPSSHNPHNPSTTCQPLPFPLAPQTSLKVISIFSHGGSRGRPTDRRWGWIPARW
ncbi:hypothetical protein CK494_016760 [Klebsiella pneumoniae]|nr:hypothetical protein CK494_016760 [Klebsiella pneumoniae]